MRFSGSQPTRLRRFAIALGRFGTPFLDQVRLVGKSEVILSLINAVTGEVPKISCLPNAHRTLSGARSSRQLFWRTDEPRPQLNRGALAHQREEISFKDM